MVHRRVYEEAQRAIEVHRWIESEKAGCDLGIAAEQDWILRHWPSFYRNRFVLHLLGEGYYEEFGTDCFQLWSRRFAGLGQIPEIILERVRNGAENLDQIFWAQAEALPRDEVLNVLKNIDLNGHRLPSPALAYA